MENKVSYVKTWQWPAESTAERVLCVVRTREQIGSRTNVTFQVESSIKSATLPGGEGLNGEILTLYFEGRAKTIKVCYIVTSD